jgi:hypothetical protein
VFRAWIAIGFVTATLFVQSSFALGQPPATTSLDDPETFSEHIRIAYTSVQALGRPPIPRFTATYSDATRSLAITFASPLPGHQTVRVELLEGIVAANGRPFEPRAFVFRTGD